MIGWNVFVVLLAVVSATVNNRSYASFFDDGAHGIVISLFLVAWSLIAFGIGRHFRKDFLLKREFYREQAPELDEAIFDKAFKAHYTAKNAKMLAILFATAIPWYAIGYVRESLKTKDLIVILLLTILSSGFLGLYYVKSKSPGISKLE